MSNEHTEIDLLQIVRTLWLRKFSIVFWAIVFGALGYFYLTEVAKSTYRSAATVALESREQAVTDLDSLVGGLSAEQPSLNTEIHLIRSRQLLGRLVTQENLLDDPEFNPSLAEVETFSIAGIKELILGPQPTEILSQEEMQRIAVDRLRTKLSVTNPRQSFVFEIAFTVGDPEKAARLANALANLYINDQLLYKEEQSIQAIDFLGQRTSELQVALGESELAVKDFAASTDLISPETLAAKNRQVKELRDRIDELTRDASALQSLLFDLSDVEPGALTDDLVRRADDTALFQLQSRLASGQSISASAQTAVLDGARLRIEQQVTQLQQQKAGLETAVSDLGAEIEIQSRDLLTLQQLQREADATGEIYLYFLTRLKEAEVQQGTQQADARLLSAAVLPLQAASPRRAIIMGAAVMFGLVFGAVIALLRETTKGGVRTAEVLEAAVDIPVLGQLPLGGFKSRKAFLPFMVKNKNDVFSEAIRNLRTSVLLANPDNPPKVILFTSSVPAEGKTTSAISMAYSLSTMGKKVILIENDIRRLTLSEYFGNQDLPTLVDLVKKVHDDEPLPIKETEQGFAVVEGGNSKQNAADFFSSEDYATLLSRLRKDYDHIILDAPPILPVADARIAGRLADTILYACAWDSTRLELVKSGISEFEDIGLKPSGLLLTKIDAKKARQYGGATRYGSYYGSYGKGYYG